MREYDLTFYCAPKRDDSDIKDKPITSSLKYTYTSLGLNFSPMLIALWQTTEPSISSQIAVQIAFSAVSKQIPEYAKKLSETNKNRNSTDLTSLSLTKLTMKRANSDVYHYLHKMTTYNPPETFGVVATIDQTSLSVAKAGSFSVLLWRDDQLIDMYKDLELEIPDDVSIGANSQVLADIASIKVRGNDIIILSSALLPESWQQEAPQILRKRMPLTDLTQRLGTLATQTMTLSSEVAFHDCVIFFIQVKNLVIPLTNEI